MASNSSSLTTALGVKRCCRWRYRAVEGAGLAARSARPGRRRVVGCEGVASVMVFPLGCPFGPLRAVLIAVDYGQSACVRGVPIWRNFRGSRYD